MFDARQLVLGRPHTQRNGLLHQPLHDPQVLCVIHRALTGELAVQSSETGIVGAAHDVVYGRPRQLDPAMSKSTINEIRARFDADVERFSNLDTGQSTTIDAPLVLELIAEAAAATTPNATHLLDIGCGAGN